MPAHDRIGNAAAAAMLGIGPNSLEQWRVRGKGPAFYRINGRISYDPADVETWIAAQRVEPAAA